MTYRTRFAPSPTGPLHLGHAFSALTASARARERGGEFLVRIEDLDRGRARPHWEALIHEDLAWLGLAYAQPCLRQSEREGAYVEGLATLWEAGLLYPCSCRRRDIEAAVSAPQAGAPLIGPDGLVYPGTCRRTPSGPMPAEGVLRLDMKKAADAVDDISFDETGRPPFGRVRVASQYLVDHVGDVVLRRRDMGAAYHLAVVMDDAAQEITEVTRGDDLFEATAIHVVLQRSLGLPSPAYHHHRLIRDERGRRLAKRDDARALATLRADGWSPADIRAAVGLP